MSSEVLDRIVTTPESAHQAATQAYVLMKAVIAEGKKGRIVAQEHEDDRSIQQNRFYWGPCLKEIAEQARIDGQRYVDEAWHEAVQAAVPRLRDREGLRRRAQAAHDHPSPSQHHEAQGARDGQVPR